MLDRTLSFGPHIAVVTARVPSHNRLLASLSGRDWGWGKDNLWTTYLAMQRTVLTYAEVTWMPLASDTNIACLERCKSGADTNNPHRLPVAEGSCPINRLCAQTANCHFYREGRLIL